MDAAHRLPPMKRTPFTHAHTATYPLAGYLVVPPHPTSLQASGRLQRQIASSIRIPQPSSSGRAADSQAAAAAGAAGSVTVASLAGPPQSWSAPGRFGRAHRLSPTALALTSDDRTVFTVGKDGSIFKWDVETWKKTQLERWVRDRAFCGGMCQCGRWGTPRWRH